MRLVDADYIKESVKRQCDKCRKEGMKWMADRVERAFIEELDNTPTAQPHWIPCNEKKPETMPKTNEDVLLQFSSNMGVGFYQDGWAVNTGEGIYSAVDISEEKPIAWMPLPPPYGGDSE